MLQSAGGIGGLVAIEQVTGSNAGSYACFYDGNGNLGQLIDIATGAVAAKYEYDPYGNNLLDPTDPTESGPYAAGNPIRFSTKHWDDETGLGYWGYRYYSPALGRWLSRDPIAEPGAMLVQRVVVSGAHFLPRDPIHANGPNYYRALRNDPIQRVDPDGGQSISFPGVGPIGPGGPGNWPPGVPYPPIPVPPPPPAQPRTQDLVYLHCYEPVRHTGLYHCDVECLPTSGPPVIGGGTGPESSGGLQGPGGNPGWIDKPGINPGSISGGWTYAPAGTCACIKQKAAKMNQIIGKEYQFPNPCRPTTSNSNAMLSTLLRCCGVSMKPTRTDWVTRHGKFQPQYSDIPAPGWGDSVLYQCGTTTHTTVAIPEGVPVSWSVPCLCPVTCDMLN